MRFQAFARTAPALHTADRWIRKFEQHIGEAQIYTELEDYEQIYELSKLNFKGEIKDLKILRDGYILEVFVNGGESIYSALL